MTTQIKLAIEKTKQGKIINYKLIIDNIIGDGIAIKARDANRLIKQLPLKIASVTPDIYGNLLHIYQ